MTETRATDYRDIPGWFNPIDHRLFTGLLSNQASTPPGDLVEIGVFMGKSAVVIGDHLRPDERFVALDLFGDLSLLGEDPQARTNKTENQKSYARLTRERFEQHYLSVHDSLPDVVQAPSDTVMDHVEERSVRFVHVDASHLYDPVAEDCRSVKKMLRPGGVAAFDDWRNGKCPGVAAAIWESVVRDGLVPVATTNNKLYAAHEGAEDVLASVRRVIDAEPEWWLVEEHLIMGHTVLRLASVAAEARRRAAKARDQHSSSPAPAGAGRATAVRRIGARLRSTARSLTGGS